LWQASGKAVGKLEGHTSTVNVVTWSPRGNLLASGGADMTVRLWLPNSGKKPEVIKDSLPIVALAFNPDGSVLAGGTPDEVVRVWETGTGKQITKGIRSPRTSPPGVTCVSWSADGNMMLAGRANHTMQLWDLNTPKIVYDLQAMTPVQYCAWAGNGSMMVAGDSDGTVRFWDGPTGIIRGLILDEGDHVVLLSGNGNYRLDKAFHPDFFYVLQTEKEQLTVKVEDFANHYKWKNVPNQVKFANK
jgi:WD40 repeat protein